MTAVMVELTTRRPEPAVQDADEVVLIADIEEVTAGSLPGCSDDNPYN